MAPSRSLVLHGCARRGVRCSPGAGLVAALALLVAAGCGKKGPPLAPVVRVPAAVEEVTTRRVGNEAYVTFTIPTANIDDTTPADVRRIDVYAYTGLTPPPPRRFVEVASVVGSFAVAPPPVPPGSGLPVPPPPPPGAPAAGVPAAGPLQGTRVTIRDPLSAEDLQPKEVPALPTRVRQPAIAVAPTLPPDAALRRFYLVIGFGDGNRPSPQSPVAALPMTLLPETPSAVRTSYTATTLALEWEPSGGIVGFLLDRALPMEAPPSERLSETALRGAPLVPGNLPAGATAYNVYRYGAPSPLALPARAVPPQPWSVPLPVAVNNTPLAAPTFTEPVVFDGREICYEVRAVRGTGAAAVEGAPSERVCVTPHDTFAPATPRGVSAVAAEGVMDLVWEPNTELDLAGYVVLRGEAGDATLTPLFERPIAETRYSDTTVTAGRRYVYAVVAADARLPVANVSPESLRVEETAR